MRADAALKINFSNERGESITALTKDISAGGVDIVGHLPLAIGKEFNFALYLPKGWPLILFKGKVAWSYCKDSQCFSGISFTKIQEVDKALLSRFVYLTLHTALSSKVS